MSRRRAFVTRPAEQDLAEIRRYLSRQSEQAWPLMRERFRLTIQRLARHPGVGHSRPDLADEHVLFYPVASYLVLYTCRERNVIILRILHGARDVPAALASDLQP